MLDTYDDTALRAESASELSAPVADYAAGQQGDISGIHTERLETLIHAAAEQALPAGASYQAGQSVTPLANRSDDIIQGNLVEFLAGATGNATINSYLVEAAQEAPEEMLAILMMDEDELEDQNFNHPLAQAAKARLMATKMAREAHEEMAEHMNAQRKEWLKATHEFGGHSFTGQELSDMNDFLKDQDNIDAFEQNLMETQGLTKAEAKTRVTKVKRALELMNKPDSELTPEERAELDRLRKDKEVGDDLERLKKQQENGLQADLSVKAVIPYTADSSKTSSLQQTVYDNASPPSGSTSGSFSLNAENPIKTEVALKETYNTNASATYANANSAPAPAPEQKPAVIAQKQTNITVEAPSGAGWG